MKANVESNGVTFNLSWEEYQALSSLLGRAGVAAGHAKTDSQSCGWRLAAQAYGDTERECGDTNNALRSAVDDAVCKAERDNATLSWTNVEA